VYLPDVLALALSSMLDEVTDEQMDEYGSILGDPGDDRKGQLIHNYDAVHDYIQEQIAEHSLEEPPLFQKGYIDRHCLLYFNKKKETITAEQAAKTVVEYLVENNLGEHVQYTTKAGGFKIKLTGIEPPSNIKEALQLCTSSISSTFKGSGKVRTRFLGKQLLEEDDIENLMGSCDTFEAGLQEAFNNFQKKKAKFAEEMFEDMDSESEDEHPEKGVDGEIVDNEEQPSLSQSLPPTKKLRSTRQARQNPKPMLEANISGPKEDSFTCQKEGCPSYGHLFPSKDGYNKHCRTKRHVYAESPKTLN